MNPTDDRLVADGNRAGRRLGRRVPTGSARGLLVGAAVLFTGIASGCAVNPVTGERELALVSESQEIEIGRDADQDVVQSLGLVGDASLQDYVQRLGEEMARASERPNLPWTFRVVDDPVVNAFALPGGFIYVTRGIMGHFASEAELAGVLGHEIGHVTARHSVSQMSRAQLAQLGLGVGTILAPDLAPWAEAAEAGLGLLFLSYGREDESQADGLGLRYMTREGYDPAEMAETFAMLAATAGDAAGSIPSFLSTHPDPLARRERILESIERGDVSGEVVAREEYLRRLEGMVFGSDPRQGYFEGTLFFHPELAFSLAFPSGWNTANGREAVQGISAEQDALIVLTLADGASPSAALNDFLGAEGVNGSNTGSRTVNGLAAATADFTAATEQGTLRGTALFVELGGRVYEIFGYAPESVWNQRAGVVRGALASFRRVTDPAVLNAQPDEIGLVRIDSSMTIEEFDRRYPSAVPLETLAVINHVGPGETIPSGTLLKRVVSSR